MLKNPTQHNTKTPIAGDRDAVRSEESIRAANSVRSPPPRPEPPPPSPGRQTRSPVGRGRPAASSNSVSMGTHVSRTHATAPSRPQRRVDMAPQGWETRARAAAPGSACILDGRGQATSPPDTRSAHGARQAGRPYLSGCAPPVVRARDPAASSDPAGSSAPGQRGRPMPAPRPPAAPRLSRWASQVTLPSLGSSGRPLSLPRPRSRPLSGAIAGRARPHRSHCSTKNFLD